MTEDLYTANDVKRVREKLYKEQGGLCKLSNFPITPKEAVLDHVHNDEQYVRGVLHRQCNQMEGRFSNAWKRYMAWWYPGKPSDFLRLLATYLDEDVPADYRHNAWIKKIHTLFNSLTEGQKESVLKQLNRTGSNGKQRKEEFKKAVLSRDYSYGYLRELILTEKKE